MSKTDDDPSLERTREEKLKALLRRDGVDEQIRRVARRALERRQEGSS